MNWFLIGGYFALFYSLIVFPRSLIGYFRQDRDNLNPILGLISSLFLLILGVALFANSDNAEAGEIGTIIVVGVLILSLILGVIVSIYKATKNANSSSIVSRIAISTIAGVLTSGITFALGIAEGISLVPATIGGIVFLSVSIFGA